MSKYSSSLLVKYRLQLDWTQDDLAAAAGFGQGTISNWENKGFPKNISKKKIEQLCEALQITPDRLETPVREQMAVMSLEVMQDILVKRTDEIKPRDALEILRYFDETTNTNKEEDDTTLDDFKP